MNPIVYAGKIEVKVFHEAHFTNCVWRRLSDDIMALENAKRCRRGALSAH